MVKGTDVIVKIGADVTGLNRGLKSAGSSVNGFSDKVSRRMKIAGTMLVGAAAAIGGAALKMAGDFDGAMREVNTMMQLSEEQFKAFSKEIQTVSRELGVSATDSAKALYQAISAGIPKENIVEFLEIATKAAIGGVTDTTTAVDGLTTVLNAFKIPVNEAQRVADIMFTTVKGGKTTFEELSASLFNVAPIAAASGVKFEEVAAALASITKQGVPTSVATTQLRAAIQALTAPTSSQKAAMEELGLTMNQTVMENEGLAGAFNMVAEATGGNMEKLRQLVGSVEGVQAILALTGKNAETFQGDLEAMAGAAGAATDAFDQMENTTARKFAKIKAQFQDIGITIGTALLPILIKLLESLTPIIEKVGVWIEKHPKLTTALLAGAAVLGVLLIILPKLIAIFGILKGVTVIGTAVQWALNVAMSANPIGLIILAIAGLIVGIIALIKNFDKVKGAFQAVGRFIMGVFEGIASFFDRLVDGIKAVFWKVIDAVLTPIRIVVNGVLEGINWVIRLMNKLPGVNLKEIGWKFPEFATSLQHGGIVSQPTLALIGERGPEAVVPLRDGGMGGPTVNVTVYGSVKTERELADIIYDQLVTKKRYNAVLGLS